MPQRLDLKLECRDCGVIYLDIPVVVSFSTIIHCSECGATLGTWFELESSFIAQGGYDGIFEMDKGQIIRRA